MQKPVWIYMGKDEFGNPLNIWSTGNKLTWYGGLVAVGYFVGLLVVRLSKSVRQGISGNQAMTLDQTTNKKPNRFIEAGRFSIISGFFTALATKCLTNQNLKFLFLLVAYFGMFLPWALSPRIMFIYHYLPALPFLFLLLAKFLLTLIDKFSGFIVRGTC